MGTGINQSCIMQAPLADFISACSAAGIHEVELRTPKLVEAYHQMSARAIHDLLDAHEMTVTAINSLEDFGLVPTENLPMLRRETESMAEFCRVCDCRLVVAPVSRWFERDVDRGWVTSTTADRLRFVAEILDASGIEVGLEPIAYRTFTVWSLEHAWEIVEKSHARNVSLVADVYNLIRGDSTIDSMRRFGDRISIIHLDDAPTQDFASLDLVHDRSFPGDGVLNPDQWVWAAREGGFDGPCSIEIFPKDVWDLAPVDAANLCAKKCQEFDRTMDSRRPRQSRRN